MSKVMRSVKNVTKGYSSAQVKVREGQNSLRSRLRRWNLAADSDM